MSALAAALLEKIATRRARTGVVGLGYVGLPLAVELAKSGFHATGIDLDGLLAAAEFCEQALGRELHGRVTRSGLHPLLPG